jgi:MarR family multiple antibiotic resistance transcriptional regulator
MLRHSVLEYAVAYNVFFDDLVRCETRLYNAANDRLRDRHGIVTSQYEFLRYIRDNPGARVADLAATFAIGIGATSKGIDRLEQQGRVARQPNPADRRSSLLALTGSGRELIDAAEITFDALLTELIGDHVTETVAATFATLRQTLERDRIGLPTG